MTDQEKREKVIGELERCLDDAVAAVVPSDTVQDAIDLLKEYGTEYNPLLVYLALYAPAPENAPDDWYHHGDENLKAWREFVRESQQRGYYTFPVDKAQEPRVMTSEEIEALERGEVVWYEQHTPERDYIQPMVADGRGYIGNADLGVMLCYLGHCERLWTAEPTDEQRQAVKWE